MTEEATATAFKASADTATSAPFRYGAFVSYRHVDPDRQWAKWLHSKLESYRVPTRLVSAGTPDRIGRVFRDEEELAASADLSERIDNALTEARFLVVVCSPRTLESHWVNEEVRRFRTLGRADRLLALLLEGEPAQAFPPSLFELEPLAADVRPIPGEGERAIRKAALLKLVAGILGVPYDELRRREEERARRRLAWLAGGTTLLTLIFLSLTLFAWQQWDRAETELRVSRAQNLAAQAQIANITTASTETLDTAGPDRAVLLALESLNAYPTVAGDLVLRAGMRRLGGAPLEVPIEEGADLMAVGPQANSVILQTENGLRELDVATGQYRDADSAPRMDMPADGEQPNSAGILARSPDGRLYVRNSEDGIGGWVFASASVERSNDGKRLALLPHEWQISLAAFSPDSRWLATVTSQASLDAAEPSATSLVGSTVRVWEVSSWRKLTEVSLAQEGGIEKAVVSPDGAWLATVSETPQGKVVLLWPLWPELLRAEACKRLTRNLSNSEWIVFLNTEPHRETCPGLPVVSE